MKISCIHVGVLVGSALVLGGCVTPENDRITLGRTAMIPAFTPPPAPPADLARPVGTLVVHQPSLTTLDRSNWDPTVFTVPVDGTAHRLLYAKRLHVADRTARQRSQYPTAESALELTGDSLWQQQAEAVGNHAVAALDLFLLVPRLVWAPPWRVRWSPDVAYQRWVQPEVPPAPEVVEAPLEDPFAPPPPHPVTP